MPEVEFNGPLEVLLTLVRRHELDLGQLNLALLTRQFIAWLNEQDLSSLLNAYSYLVMAATLLELKSKRLLPKPIVDTEEEPSDLELMLITSEAELAQKLNQYSCLQLAAERLRERLELAQHYFARGGIPSRTKHEMMLADMDISDLLAAITRVAEHKASKQPIQVFKAHRPLPKVLKELRFWMATQASGGPLQELLFMPSDLAGSISYFIGTLELINQGEWQIAWREQDWWLESASTTEKDISVPIAG